VRLVFRADLPRLADSHIDETQNCVLRHLLAKKSVSVRDGGLRIESKRIPQERKVKGGSVMNRLRKADCVLSFILAFVVFGTQVALAALDLSDATALDESVGIESTRAAYDRRTGEFSCTVTTSNTSAEPISAPVYLVIESITSPGVSVTNANGTTTEDQAYFVLLQDGQLLSGESVSTRVAFANPQREKFAFACAAYAISVPVRPIEFARANPDVIYVCHPTTVTVTVQIAADVEFLADEIYLLQIDNTGTILADFGPMYDDATHGDSQHGDGTFTTQVSFHGTTPGEIILVVEVHYTAPPTPAYSDLIVVNVVSPPPPEAVDEVLAINASASQEFDALVSQVGIQQARQVLLDSLQDNPAVADAFLSGDGTTICITYQCGLEGGILAGPEGTKAMPSNSTGVAASHPEFNNATIIAGTLNGSTCVNCSTLPGSSLTLDQVNNFDTRGVIYLDTHGVVYGPSPATSPVVIMTGEQASTFLGIPTSHFWDWLLGRVLPLASGGVNYWCFKPSFIEAHCTSFPGSLVVASACHSYEDLTNTTMANAFLNAGCLTYVGWSDTVSVDFANGAAGIDNTLFTRLANGNTVQQAFGQWTLAQRTDPSTGAVYGYVGAGDTELPSELIENGSFETSDLSGWTTGFTEGGDFPEYGCPGGYRAVTSAYRTEGTYSARLGKFDQPYVYGLHGQAQPGNQPAGREWMYQDVEIPAGSNKTLSFWWKMRTFDTAVWDWFDARILDPGTNQVLATIVDKGGKPGVDYGVYWENDWQTVGYDLSAFAGQIIRLRFDQRCNGWGDQTATYIDEISIPCD